MEGNGSGEEGLMEEHVDLEDDSINFWATLGVSPHAHAAGAEHEGAVAEHLEQLQQQQAMAALAADGDGHGHGRRDLFEGEGDPRLEPFVGMEFESGEAAKTFYIAYAGRVGFCVRIARSRRSKCNEKVIMLRFVCSREGWSREKRVVEGKKTRKRAASIREGCRAMLEVIRKGGADGRWLVTKLVKEHNHPVGMPSRVHYIATDADSASDPFPGMEFDSLEAARTFYYAYASRLGFEARVRQSRRSLHDDSLKMLKLVCSRHRYHSARDPPPPHHHHHHHHHLVEAASPAAPPGCEALFEIVRREGGKWVLSKLVVEHSHPLEAAAGAAGERSPKVRCVRSQGEILVIAKNLADTRSLLLSQHEAPGFSRDVRYNDLGLEDAQALLEHLRRTQAESPGFVFSAQLLDRGFMGNVFWADARARMAYHFFGDAVFLDTAALAADKGLIPLVAFAGVNHHLQPVVFGCALLVDDSEASLAWLFETWLAAMADRAPVSLTTELSPTMAAAAAKALPATRHRFCRRSVLARLREELADVAAAHLAALERDLACCLDAASDSCEAFESCWDALLDRYRLRGRPLLQSLHGLRHRWAPPYLRDAFFADVLGAPPRPDSVVLASAEKYLGAKTPLRVAVRQLAQALAWRQEEEAQADLETLFNKPFLKTASPMEKQAASVYTRAVFDRFQEEFVESLGYHVERLDEGKYCVAKTGGAAYMVAHSAASNRASCSCGMFEYAGILCRHALRVFIVVGVRTLPRDYVLRRWTRNAKSSGASDDCSTGHWAGPAAVAEDPAAARYGDLCRDALKCAREGASSPEFYKVAKEALQRAVAEVVAAKQSKEQQTLHNLVKSQRARRQQAALSLASHRRPLAAKALQKQRAPSSVDDHPIAIANANDNDNDSDADNKEVLPHPVA
ncbi:protein FAR1-RELATED SEQUENCE 5-like isoform X2 [Wolffia australiana]